jgi:hypothetical protein
LDGDALSVILIVVIIKIEIEAMETTKQKVKMIIKGQLL